MDHAKFQKDSFNEWNNIQRGSKFQINTFTQVPSPKKHLPRISGAFSTEAPTLFMQFNILREPGANPFGCTDSDVEQA